jgi:hypothetical protein
MRFASVVTGINVLVAGGYAIAGLVNPQSILPAGMIATQGALVFAMYAAARTIPLAIFVFVAIFKRSRCGLLIVGSLAGCSSLWMRSSGCTSTTSPKPLVRSF